MATTTYALRDKEAGNIIEVFATLEEANATLAKFEQEDKNDGTYTEDFYEVAIQ